MSKIDKLIAEMLTVPADFKYADLRCVLNHLGYDEETKGLTSGSRVGYRNADNDVILLHKPHKSGDGMSRTALRSVIQHLRDSGVEL